MFSCNYSRTISGSASPWLKFSTPGKINRSGSQNLAQRLDRFLIKEAFHARLSRARQWVGNGGILDHRPIFLELDDNSHKVSTPFKFNPTWLRDHSYIRLVTEFWLAHPITGEVDPAKGFVSNLMELKGLSREWAHKEGTGGY